jgi:hypothetical protein
MTTQSYKGLSYSITEEPDGTFSAQIEDMLRLFDYKNKDILLTAVKGSIQSLDRAHSWSPRHDGEPEEPERIEDLRAESGGVDASKKI